MLLLGLYRIFIQCVDGYKVGQELNESKQRKVCKSVRRGNEG